VRLFNRFLLGWALLLTVLLITLIGLATWFYAVDTRHPIVYNNLPFPVDKAVYKPGDIVERTMDLCIQTASPGTIAVAVYGTHNYAFPAAAFAGMRQECKVVYPRFTLPQDIAPGVYWLAATLEFQVNRFSKRQVQWSTATFEVVAK